MATPMGALPRRTLMRGALAGAVLGPALGLTRSASAQQKMSRQEARYQETPKGIQMCASCTLYLPPSACKSVEGEVAASGWCKLFDMVD
jgi:hypothetical protein